MMTSQPAEVVTCANCGRKNRVPAAATGLPRCGHCHQPLPWITAADDDCYHDVVDGAALPVLVDLWAPWCGPCRVISPTLETLARSRPGTIKLVKVNVDEAPRVASSHGAQSIPTLLVVNRGEVVARHIGAAPEHTIRAWLDEALTHLPGSPPAG
ncbi:MAG: thioredoxin [Ilumatobacteraceae bacterium]